MKTRLLFFAAALAGISAAADEPLQLVVDGKANAVIVISGKPSGAAKIGAEILSDHLFQISGARFETVSESDLKETNANLILVGRSRIATNRGALTTDLGPGGMMIKTLPGALILMGTDRATPTDPDGTRYAVTTFLEDQLGVRFLWPGEMGKVVPKKRTIEIGTLDVKVTPMIQQRRIRSALGWGERKGKGGDRLKVNEEDYWRVNKAAVATESADGGWFSWHRQGGTLRLASGHAFGYMWEKYKDVHPEWFAMGPDGSRDQSRSPDRSRLCVSNEELIKSIAREKTEQLNRSETNSVSIGPNDGGQTPFCVCPECKKLDPPQKPGEARSLTDRYVYFWNGIAERVSKTHPDAWLGADAYSVYSAPPVNATLHPNIAIRYVGISYTNEEKRRSGLAGWHGWADSASKVYFRSNLLLAGRRQGIPAIYPHKLAKDFRDIAHNKMLGTDFDSCCHNWATQGLNYYVLAKLLWDPDRDVDELIDDYCKAGFGAGADSVKQYFLRLEELTNEVADKQSGLAQPYTSKVISELQELLDEAGTLTEADLESHVRVEFLKAGLDYTAAFVAFFRLEEEHKAAGGGRIPPEMKQRMRDALDRNWLVSRTVFEENHLAVNVATVAWGTWSYFARFGWNEPSEGISYESGK